MVLCKGDPMKLYLAGPLFNDAQVARRKLEGQFLRERFPQLSIFNPIEQPFNQNKQSLPTPIDIYEGDTNAVLESDIFLCDVSVEDMGVACELGIALQNKTPLIIAINSDIRLQSANKYDVPSYAMNHYVLGGILKHGHFVRTFDEALDIIENYLNNKK